MSLHTYHGLQRLRPLALINASQRLLLPHHLQKPIQIFHSQSQQMLLPKQSVLGSDFLHTHSPDVRQERIAHK